MACPLWNPITLTTIVADWGISLLAAQMSSADLQNVMPRFIANITYCLFICNGLWDLHSNNYVMPRLPLPSVPQGFCYIWNDMLSLVLLERPPLQKAHESSMCNAALMPKMQSNIGKTKSILNCIFVIFNWELAIKRLGTNSIKVHRKLVGLTEMLRHIRTSEDIGNCIRLLLGNESMGK